MSKIGITISSSTNSAKRRWLLTNSSGTSVLSFTSFLSLDVRNESQVVEGPVEEGSFASYNKIETPLELSVSVGISGTDTELQTALKTLDTLQSGTDLLSLVTPNAEYTDLSLVAVNYRRRREEGLGVLWLDLSLQQVKQVAAASTSVTLASKTSRGKQQTTNNDSMLTTIIKKFSG